MIMFVSGVCAWPVTDMMVAVSYPLANALSLKHMHLHSILPIPVERLIDRLASQSRLSVMLSIFFGFEFLLFYGVL